MKKLFLVLSAAFAFCIGASAANEYTAVINGDVTVTNLSKGTNYMYQLEFKQMGNGTYLSDVLMIIYPDGPSIAGTYSLVDGTVDSNSYVYYAGDTRYVTDFVSGSTAKRTNFTITDLGNGSYSLDGAFRTKYYNTSKKTWNYYYYYYTAADNIFTVDPFKPEPPKGDKTFSGENISAEDYRTWGYVEVDLNANDGTWIALGFPTDTYDVPAGTYEISTSGAKGTIMAATGAMDGYNPLPSYYAPEFGSSAFYFIVGGQLEVSYDSSHNMTVSGTAVSGHGSNITISATGLSPFYVPDPETYTLTVSSVAAELAYDNTYFGLSIGAKNGEKTCNGYVKVLDDEIVGEFGNDDLSPNTYFGSCYLDNTDADNKVSIVATGNENEYKLNLRLRLDDNNIYVIKDAVFTYVAPTPFDPEPDTPTTIDATFNAEPYIYNEGASKSRVVIEFMSSDGSYIDLAFTAKALADILPCHYLVNDSKALGTVQASAGRVSGEDTPSFFAKGIGFFDYNPYYITGGELDVTFLASGMLRITGVLTTAKGSTINVNISGKNTVNKNALPENVINGYVLGTDATYMFAYDVTTDASGYVTVDATAWTDKTVEGFKPQITIGADTADMSYDAATGACSYKIPSSYSKGDKVKVGVSFTYGAGSTVSRTIDYVVE